MVGWLRRSLTALTRMAAGGEAAGNGAAAFGGGPQGARGGQGLLGGADDPTEEEEEAEEEEGAGLYLYGAVALVLHGNVRLDSIVSQVVGGRRNRAASSRRSGRATRRGGNPRGLDLGWGGGREGLEGGPVPGRGEEGGGRVRESGCGALRRRAWHGAPM